MARYSRDAKARLELATNGRKINYYEYYIEYFKNSDGSVARHFFLK
jgi:hypothetical protein